MIGASTPGRTLQFALLAMTAAAAMYARFSIAALQEAIRNALSLTDNQMALLQGPALALPMAIAAIPLGLLIDRYSRTRLLVVFAILYWLGTLLTALAPSFLMLFAARALVGLSVAAASTTVFSLLADLFDETQRGRATMVVAIGQYGGISSAFALGGVLLASSAPGPDQWRHAMLEVSLPLVITAAMLVLMREPERNGVMMESPSLADVRGELWRYRAVIAPLMVGLVLAEVGVLAVTTWAAPTFSRTFALTPERIGALMALALLVSGLSGPAVGGLLADVCQKAGGARRTTLALSALALLSAPVSLFPLAPNPVAASVMLVAFLTLVTAILVMGTTLFTIVVPNEVRGVCLASLAGAQVVFGVGLAPVVVSGLSGAIGGPAMIGRALALASLAAGFSSAAAFVLLWRRQGTAHGVA